MTKIDAIRQLFADLVVEGREIRSVPCGCEDGLVRTSPDDMDTCLGCNGSGRMEVFYRETHDFRKRADGLIAAAEKAVA